MKSRRSSRKKKAAKPVPLSGVPRHNYKVSDPPLPMATRDVTRESVTSYLQPFVAYESRMMGTLPTVGTNKPVYGFWTRNVVQATEIVFNGGSNGGVAIRVTPWDITQVLVAATYSDTLGTPATFVSYNDPFYSAMATNFIEIVCCYQGVRVKNITAVLGQAGESVIGRSTYGEALTTSYSSFRNSGTSFVKSSADPGVMMQMTYQGLTGMEPPTAGYVCDYQWCPPGTSNYDGDSTAILFRSQSAAATPQTFSVEIVNYYLAVPFAATSVFFSPVKHEFDPKKFNRMIDAAESKSPELSVSRVAMKDDGENPSIVDDLQSIWNGAKSLGRVASSAWGALTSFFSLAKSRRHRVLLEHFADDDDVKEFIGFMSTRSLDRARSDLQDQSRLPCFTQEQIDFLRSALQPTSDPNEDDYVRLPVLDAAMSDRLGAVVTRSVSSSVVRPGRWS